MALFAIFCFCVWRVVVFAAGVILQCRARQCYSKNTAMKTEKTTAAKPCNCLRGMIIIATLFVLTVSIAVFSLVSLYRSIG